MSARVIRLREALTGRETIDTQAVVLAGPRDLGLTCLPLDEPKDGQIVIDISHSGISTGTEKLFWRGEMPPFPGMGYPLVPGYEAVGEVVEAPASTALTVGDTVFVPGASCYGEVRGLFGGAAARVVTAPDRVIAIDPGFDETGALLALAATARHAIAGLGATPPELIIGHGVLGRLLARLTIAAGAPTPTVWETDPARRSDETYPVMSPEDDPRRDYRCIYDATGDPSILDQVMMRLVKGGEIVLAGFYAEPLSFAFPPAFMKEARIRVAAEWAPEDLAVTRSLVETGALSLDGLITHRRPSVDAVNAYETAFNDADCLKMILDWKGDT